jgi:hypothetical protein
MENICLWDFTQQLDSDELGQHEQIFPSNIFINNLEKRKTNLENMNDYYL